MNPSPHGSSPPASARVLVHPGDRACEAALLDALDALLPGAGVDLALLASPVRVVVASKSLRLHVLERVLRHRGRAIAGLQVQTLAGLAAELLADAGQRVPHADALLPVLVRRRAAQVPALALTLGPLEGGLIAVARPVAELLDAGFTPDRDAVPMARLLAGVDAPEAERLRALGLVEVAGLVSQDLREGGMRRGTDSLRAAADLVRGDPAALRCRALLLYGFVDPGPAELDLLQVLIQQAGARLFLSAPAEIGAELSGPPPPPPALAWRLAGDGGVACGSSPLPGPELSLCSSPGRQAEARHVARCVRALLDRDPEAGGAVPERIGLVLRDPGDWAAVLRPELERLSIPFSAVGASSPPGPALRRLSALSRVLARKGQASTDRWLDAVSYWPGPTRTLVEDLRLCFRVQGLARLEDVARLDVQAVMGDARSLPLPTRLGLGERDAPDPTGAAEAAIEVVARRRTLPREALLAAVDSARRLLDTLAPGLVLPLRDWVARIQDLVARCLGWADPDPAWRALVAAIQGLVERVGVDPDLDEQELQILLEPALLAASVGPLGGQGGGVQVLSAIEARGRSFEQLFVLGLRRGELPRSPSPDPVLSETLRSALRALLPDLPTQADRLAPERALLAHLLSAAPRVQLSWPATDDDGRLLPPSPLVERLRLARPELEVQVLPPLGGRSDPPDGLSLLPRPAAEHALARVQQAPARGRAEAPDPQLLEVLALALVGAGAPAERALALAAGREAIRREQDGGPGWDRLGPYLGLVGPGSGPVLRHQVPYATTLEAIASCGWQAFLRLGLRIEPAPDAAGTLPGVDARMVGNVVHRVLEGICRDAAASAGLDLGELGGPGLRVPWPEAGDLAARLDRAAQAEALEEGIPLPGLWRVLAARALPFLEVAREQDWPAPGPRVLGVELEEQVEVQGPGRVWTVRFRADRADRDGEGRLVLTDYKTGAALSSARKATTRDQHMIKAIAQGRRLQAALYARMEGEQAVGRYLSLRPEGLDPADPARQARVPGETQAREAFDQALGQVVQATLGAWDQGMLPPRVADPHGGPGPACAWCTVRPACVLGDSSSRQRLLRWGQQVPVEGPEAEARAGALWWLGQAREDPDTDAEGEA